MIRLYEKTWQEARAEIDKDKTLAGDLFYDWFCSTRSLNNRANKLIPRIDFVFKKLQLNPKEFKVTLKNNCPLYGDLYDSFIIDSIDDKKRIYISPRLGHSVEDLNNKCSVTVITYKEKIGGIEKLDKTFDGWQKFRNHINNSNLIEEILEALDD